MRSEGTNNAIISQGGALWIAKKSCRRDTWAEYWRSISERNSFVILIWNLILPFGFSGDGVLGPHCFFVISRNYTHKVTIRIPLWKLKGSHRIMWLLLLLLLQRVHECLLRDVFI